MKIRASAVGLFIVLVFTVVAIVRSEPARKGKSTPKPAASDESSTADAPRKLETATFGSGCFWCSEAVFQRIKGVESVVSGYSGGHVKNPSYAMVSTGLTGHAEVIQITFDPDVISYEELLDIFFKTHDPTKLNRQGPDTGPQYRSVIFYHNEEQKEVAEKAKKEAAHFGKHTRRIVTQIVRYEEFYPAEDYHQNYFNNHPENPYCEVEIVPKVSKVRKTFKDKLK